MAWSRLKVRSTRSLASEWGSAALFEFRPIDFEEDADSVCAIMAEFDADPLTPDDLVRRWRDNDKATDAVRFVAVGDGAVVGYLNCRRWPFLKEGTGLSDIGVAKAHRRKGIGRALWRTGMAHAKSKSWVEVLTRVREEEEGFMSVMGIEPKYRHFESTLRLDEVPVEAGEKYQVAVKSGIEFKSVAEFEATDGFKREFFEFFTSMDQDEPGTAEFGTMDFPSFLHETFEKRTFDPEGAIFAIKDGKWAGYHAIEPHPTKQGEAVIGFTGVTREMRGQGIAQALKWQGLDYAKSQGWGRVLTYNDTRNAAMVAINDKFGFVRQPGWVHGRAEVQDDAVL